MFRSFMFGFTGLLLGFLFVGGKASTGPAAALPASVSGAGTVTLAEVVRHLPDYLDLATAPLDSQAIENATDAERDAAVPGLIAWLKDDRFRVRGLALISLWAIYMPRGNSRVIDCSRYLPVEDVPVIAARLRDPDSRVRNAAFIALGSVENCGHGMDKLVELVLPMLRDPDILTEYPDPFFAESDNEVLAKMTPQQRAEFKALPHPLIKLPAEGPQLLSILIVATPSPAVDDAMIAFLDRPDQTESTLRDCLNILAVNRANQRVSERVKDEAQRRVLELSKDDSKRRDKGGTE